MRAMFVFVYFMDLCDYVRLKWEGSINVRVQYRSWEVAMCCDRGRIREGNRIATAVQ